MVKVNTNSNTIKVNAASAGRASNLSIGTPQSYYDGLAKEWAISDNLVQGIDYSSKYYANIAKSNADSSKANLDSVRDAAEEVIAAKDNALNDISDAKINTLESLIDEGNNQIELIKEQGSSYATKEDAKYTAGNGIDITDNIISNTQTSAEWGNITGNIENQEDLVNYVKKYSGGLEVCDIGMSLYIDETKGLRRWLNGQIVAINQNTQGFLTRLKKIVALYPSLLTTEENWQAAKTLSDYGQVGKFVFNYAQELIEEDAFIALAENDEGYDWALKKSDAGFDTITSDNYTTLIGKKVYQVILTDGKRKANGVTSTITNLTPKSVSSTSWNATIEANVTTFTLYSNTFKTWLFEQSETVESVRLPAVVNVQGLLDLQNLGMTVEAGLPNITGSFSGRLWSGDGAFTPSETRNIIPSGSGAGCDSMTFDASKSSPIYGATDTVQEEAIQYPYYIQIATGQETEVNITNEIELNNPFFFGMSQYFNVEPNNLSRLKSDGEYKPKSVYPDYYNWILENVNKGVEGFKGQEGYCFIATDSPSYYWWVSTESPVVGASVYRYDAGVNSMFFDGTVETLTSNGFTFTSIFEGSSYTVTRDTSKDTSISHRAAWITDNDFVINTSAETFRLPLLDGSECLVSDRYIDLTLQASGTKYTAVANGFVFFEKLNTSNTQFVKGTNLSSGYADISYGTYSGSTPSILLKVKRGDIFSIDYDAAGVTNSFRFIYARGNGSLYYYVGETVQNANLIDAGRMAEFYATKQFATSASLPSHDYVELTIGASGSTYTAPANGWVCFGYTTNTANRYIALENLSANWGITSWCPVGNNNGLALVLPVLKQDIFRTNYTADGSEKSLKFYYAQGEVLS